MSENGIKKEKKQSKSSRNPIPNSKPFPKGVSGNPKGRPKKYFSKYIELGYKKSEIADVLIGLLSLDKKTINEIAKDETASVLENGIAGAIQKDLNDKTTWIIKDLLDRVVGKPREQEKPEPSEGLEKYKFPFTIMPKGFQWEIYESEKRFIISNIGRQAGKTTVHILKLGQKAINNVGVYWWVSPTYSQARVVYKRSLEIYKNIIQDKNESRLEIILQNGSQIVYKSAESYDNLRGESLLGCVLDEYATMPKDIFQEIISPMLLTTEGFCWFVSTPKGKNHFWKLFQDSKKSEHFESFIFPSQVSPFVSKKEIEEIRNRTPEIIFRQEYLAEFIEDGTSVFKGFLDCVGGSLEQPQGHKKYIIGCDLAKYHDFTVLTVWDMATKQMVAYERFNQIEWQFQKQKIKSLSLLYNNAIVYMDSTGVGDPIYEDLSKEINCVSCKLTNASKANLIINLALNIERREITFPYIQEIIDELGQYSMGMLPSGRVRYNAPDGLHDDIVISMALGVSGISETIFDYSDLVN